MYLDPLWSKTRYDEYYRSEYDLEFRSELSSEAIYTNKMRNGREVLERLAPYSENVQSLLDIGAGPGAQLKVFAETYPSAKRIEGIEMSEACRRRMAQDGISTLSSDIYDDWHLTRKDTFDLITMRHVLEHCLDPDAVLTKVRSVLAPAGYFYVAVPNMASPHGNLIGYWFRIAHIWYFDMDTLVSLVKRNGFSVVNAGEGNAEIFLVLKKDGGLKNEGKMKLRPKLALQRERALARTIRKEHVRLCAKKFRDTIKTLFS